MPDTVAFVDSIASAPATRLNLNDGVIWGLNYEGTDMSPPELRRAVASTLLTDGAQIPASAYDNRVVTLRLDLKTASVDAAATQIQALMRELNRPTNFLRWQPTGATNPVTFRTFRSSDTKIVEYPGTGTFRTVDVRLLAEPFAYGIKQTIAAITVTNDPAAGANGMFFDVTSPLGDVETPLFLSIPSAELSTKQSAMGLRRRGVVTAMPLVLQCESMQMGTDTALATDALMSGAGSNYARTTFVTTTNVERVGTMILGVGGVWPAAPAVAVRGTYRVFLRCRHSVSGDVIKVQLQVSDTITLTVVNDQVTLPPGTGIRYVDLGLIKFPMGADPVSDGLSGTELEVAGQVIRVLAERTSGSGNLDMDCLMFVPADDRLALVKWASGGSIPDTYVFDSSVPQVYATNTGDVASLKPAEIAGGGLMVSPGVTNRIVFVQDVGSTSSSGSEHKANTIHVTPYYWPRYLYVRPATT